MVGNSHIIQGLRTLKTNLDYGIFAALQRAAETALSLPDHYLEEVQQRYSARRDFLIDEFASLGWTVDKPKATMYLWVPCPLDIPSSTEFALTVLQETGVVVTPGNAFGPGGEGYIRVSLIADCDRLAVAMDRIRQAGFHFASDQAA